jgi:hypothetical protein
LEYAIVKEKKSMTGLVLLGLALLFIAPVEKFFDGAIHQLGAGPASFKLHLLQSLKDLRVDPRAEERLCGSPGHSGEHATNVSQTGENAHSCMTFASVIHLYSAGRVTPFGVTDAPGRKAVPQGQEQIMVAPAAPTSEKSLYRAWLARRATDGLPLGYLVMRGARPLAFVQCGDNRQHGFPVVRRIIETISTIGRGKLFGFRIHDLRRCDLRGDLINLPWFLFNAAYFPLNDFGKVQPMKNYHFAKMDVVREAGQLRVMFAAFRSPHQDNLPRWMEDEKSGKSANSTIAQRDSKSDEKSGLLTAAA